MVEVVDPVADAVVDAEGSVDVGGVVDGNAGEGESEVVLAIAVEDGRGGV